MGSPLTAGKDEEGPVVWAARETTSSAEIPGSHKNFIRSPPDTGSKGNRRRGQGRLSGHRLHRSTVDVGATPPTRSTQPSYVSAEMSEAVAFVEIARGGWAPAAGRRIHRSRWWRQRIVAAIGGRQQSRSRQDFVRSDRRYSFRGSTVYTLAMNPANSSMNFRRNCSVDSLVTRPSSVIRPRSN